MAREVAEAAGSLAQALDRAVQLLARSPRLAQKQAQEILSVVPGEPRARLVLGMALRRAGEAAGAREVLQALAQQQAGSAQIHYELGEALAVLGQTAEAAAAFGRAAELKPNHPGAWRGLADARSLLGDAEGADRACAEMIRASVTDPRLIEAAAALCDDQLAVAERLLRDHLKAHPADVAAMRMLAEAGTRLGRYGDVEALLDRCLELAPGFEAARYNQAVVLFRQQKGAAAIGHLRQLLAIEPRSPRYRSLLASCLGLVGDHQQAVDIYRELLGEFSGAPQIWLDLGHALRALGRRDEALDAYRQAAALNPALQSWLG
ncbi:MAG TPA: tetratricopeptide repeat protein [Caulobacteraceae bacterium]|jgi:predicted Zn-dependent protease